MEVHPPQPVTGTPQETAGNHEVRRESPQRREIEPASEVAEETAQELFHHPPIAEHALVGGIVLRRLVRLGCGRLSGHEPNKPKTAGHLHGGMGLSGRAELCGGGGESGGPLVLPPEHVRSEVAPQGFDQEPHTLQFAPDLPDLGASLGDFGA